MCVHFFIRSFVKILNNLLVSFRFFCPEGQTTSTPSTHPCPLGHYCPGGDSFPRPCHNDTYQNATGQSACLACPPGYFCDPSDGSVITPKPCPKGSYCPNGKRIKCAIGEYFVSIFNHFLVVSSFLINTNR